MPQTTSPMPLLRRAFVAAAALSCLSVFAQSTPAAPWPNRPVRFIVPFPAGAAPDVLARYIGQKLSERWGQAVVVDNKPGGSGVIGMTAILNAPADGTVFGFVQGSAISVAPSLIQGVRYEFHRDFVPITLGAVLPFVLAVPADSPFKTLGDLLAAARANPKAIEVADVGRGTAPHLAATLLGMKAGVQFLPVHYPGGAQTMQATLSGETKMMVDSYNVVAGNVQGGKLRILASMADKVMPGMESFPLAKDVAPGAVAYGWFAVIGRRGLDAAIVKKMNADMAEVLLMPDVVAKSRELGTYARPGPPEELARFVDEDRKTWQAVLTELNLRPE